jgi:lipid II:glycine glycyltransferase (peptidoglycan interpeptide bridge formation enzyme)
MLAYDLGGIDPDGNPGVYHFKSGLGGRDITCAGPFQAPPGPLKAAMVHALESLYRRMRRGAR